VRRCTTGISAESFTETASTQSPEAHPLDESGRRYFNVLQNYGSSMAPLVFFFDALSLQAWPLDWSVAALDGSTCRRISSKFLHAVDADRDGISQREALWGFRQERLEVAMNIMAKLPFEFSASVSRPRLKPRRGSGIVKPELPGGYCGRQPSLGWRLLGLPASPSNSSNAAR
jgi:hypothetical protein